MDALEIEQGPEEKIKKTDRQLFLASALLGELALYIRHVANSYHDILFIWSQATPVGPPPPISLQFEELYIRLAFTTLPPIAFCLATLGAYRSISYVPTAAIAIYVACDAWSARYYPYLEGLVSGYGDGYTKHRAFYNKVMENHAYIQRLSDGCHAFSWILPVVTVFFAVRTCRSMSNTRHEDLDWLRKRCEWVKAIQLYTLYTSSLQITHYLGYFIPQRRWKVLETGEPVTLDAEIAIQVFYWSVHPLAVFISHYAVLEHRHRWMIGAVILQILVIVHIGRGPFRIAMWHFSGEPQVPDRWIMWAYLTHSFFPSLVTVLGTFGFLMIWNQFGDGLRMVYPSHIFAPFARSKQS